MASVDDIDELIETRKLKVLDDGLYESDKNVASDKDYTLACLKGYADAEEKYKNRIKELEEENMQKDLEIIGTKEYTEASMKEIIEQYYTANEDCIVKQKVKDKIEELKQKAINYGHLIDKDEAFRIECEINILEELLEE